MNFGIVPHSRREAQERWLSTLLLYRLGSLRCAFTRAWSVPVISVYMLGISPICFDCNNVETVFRYHVLCNLSGYRVKLGCNMGGVTDKQHFAITAAVDIFRDYP